MFYTQITLRQGIPFAVDIPNDLTAGTLRKSRKGEEVETFANADALIASWQK
jgi:antitoxin component of RelBE/YafQ-DinJ toxin-antitoxin module